MGFSPRKFAAVGVTALLVGASTLLITTPAAAADFYVDDSQLGATEVSPYPAGWFRGNTTNPAGPYASTLSGLEVGGPFQLLYGVIGDIPLGTGLDPSNLAEYVVPGITLASGAASFQIPMFTDGAGGGYTTLYADTAGIAADTWYSSNAFGTIVAHTPYSLTDIVAQMDPQYEILAFGFNVIDADAATVVSLDWRGDRFWFLPGAPTATVTPTSSTVAEFAASGVAATYTGYVPGEDVEIILASSGSASSIATVTADAAGEVRYTVPAATALAAGDYTLSAVGVTSNVSSDTTFSVVAALAATGVDLSGPLALGGMLLAVGLVFGGLTLWRKRGATTA